MVKIMHLAPLLPHTSASSSHISVCGKGQHLSLLPQSSWSKCLLQHREISSPWPPTHSFQKLLPVLHTKPEMWWRQPERRGLYLTAALISVLLAQLPKLKSKASVSQGTSRRSFQFLFSLFSSGQMNVKYASLIKSFWGLSPPSRTKTSFQQQGSWACAHPLPQGYSCCRKCWRTPTSNTPQLSKPRSALRGS